MMAEDRYVYIVEAPDRAGGAANMVWTDNLAKEIERIASADWRRQTSRSTVTCESMSTATPTATRPGLAATG